MKEKYFSINTNGNSVRCKICADNPRSVERVVLALHGFGGQKDSLAIRHFAEKTISKYKTTAILSYDHPCHGEDALNRLTLEACDRYMGYVLQYIEEQFPEAELYNYSTSFGGYLALKYIYEHGNPFRKMALRCPAITLYELMTEKVIAPQDLEKLRSGKDILAGFDRKVRLCPRFLEEIRDFDLREKDLLDYCEDILIVQGTKDEIVSVDAVRQFADDNLIEYIPVKNADHRFTDPQIMSLTISEILKFMFA